MYEHGGNRVTQQRRSDVIAIWLGLFAMLMIHVGPLLSAVQVMSTQQAEHSAVHHLEHDAHSHASQQEPVDYHALMGHHSAPVGAPEWVAALALCGYCDLLTLSPLLILAVWLALPVLPAVQWLATLPRWVRLLAVSYSFRHSRAPPVFVFA